MLGSLSRMANLGYSLGLLENDEVIDLKILARVRNMYAHGRDRDQLYRDAKTLAVLQSLKLVYSSQQLIKSHDEQGIFRSCINFIKNRLASKAAAIAGAA